MCYDLRGNNVLCHKMNGRKHYLKFNRGSAYSLRRPSRAESDGEI